MAKHVLHLKNTAVMLERPRSYSTSRGGQVPISRMPLKLEAAS